MGKSIARYNAVLLSIIILIAGIIAIASFPTFIVEIHAVIVKKLDNYGVPWVYYKTISDGKAIGYQRNPVTSVRQADEFYELYKVNNNESAKTYFLNNVNWLVNNAIPKENYLLLPYNFPLPIYNLKAPWFSAMANGLALQVLIKAHETTQDLKYLIAAKSLLNAFFY